MKLSIIILAVISAALFYWAYVADKSPNGHANMDALPLQIIGGILAVVDILLLIIYFVFW
jgi:hypothetical protein